MWSTTFDPGLTCIVIKLTKINKQFESKQTYFVRRPTRELHRNFSGPHGLYVQLACSKSSIVNLSSKKYDV